MLKTEWTPLPLLYSPILVFWELLHDSSWSISKDGRFADEFCYVKSANIKMRQNWRISNRGLRKKSADLEGVWQKIFDFRFFSWISVPQAPKYSISNFVSFFAGVVDTADKHSFANISANFRKKFEMVLMGSSGARGTLIYEKYLMSKISCQTPFNLRECAHVYCLILHLKLSDVY